MAKKHGEIVFINALHPTLHLNKKRCVWIFLIALCSNLIKKMAQFLKHSAQSETKWGNVPCLISVNYTSDTVISYKDLNVIIADVGEGETDEVKFCNNLFEMIKSRIDMSALTVKVEIKDTQDIRHTTRSFKNKKRKSDSD